MCMFSSGFYSFCEAGEYVTAHQTGAGAVGDVGWSVPLALATAAGPANDLAFLVADGVVNLRSLVMNSKHGRAAHHIQDRSADSTWVR